MSLIAPAGPLPPGALERAVRRVHDLGWTPRVARHAGGRRGYLAGTDDERLEDMDEALRSTDNDLIWCLRGGYGTMRLLPRIDWAPLVERPRPLIGFSDNTALHLAAARQGLVTFHGPHPAAQDLAAYSLDCLQTVLGGGAEVFPPPPVDVPPPRTLVPGTAEGPLVGGNLSLLAATMGTPWAVEARGCILFLEEVGETAYRLDRLLSQLILAGALAEVAGIAIGRITECPDEGGELPTPDEVVGERLSELGVPCVIGLPFGHIPASWTLPHGMPATLRAGAEHVTLELQQPAVTETR